MNEFYASIYYDANTANGADNVTFKEKYSVSIERAARETVAEKSKKLKKRKKRNRIS
jgi:hypothetical protein